MFVPNLQNFNQVVSEKSIPADKQPTLEHPDIELQKVFNNLYYRHQILNVSGAPCFNVFTLQYWQILKRGRFCFPKLSWADMITWIPSPTIKLWVLTKHWLRVKGITSHELVHITIFKSLMRSFLEKNGVWCNATLCYFVLSVGPTINVLNVPYIIKVILKFCLII